MERDEVVEHLQAMVAGSINGKDIDTLQAATSLLENRWSGFDDEDLRELRAGAAQRYEGSKAVPEEYRERAGRLAGELRQELERREAERANYRGPGIYRAAGNGAEYVVAGILGVDVVLRGVGSEHLTTMSLTEFNQRTGRKPRFEWVRGS
jgi:hypothetical protein